MIAIFIAYSRQLVFFGATIATQNHAKKFAADTMCGLTQQANATYTPDLSVVSPKFQDATMEVL
jgi:hypothetical protein